MKMYIHVLEPVHVDDEGGIEFMPIAMFASVLDTMDFYEIKKKKNPSNNFIISDTVRHCQVDPV
jgi:hypothetical protein